MVHVVGSAPDSPRAFPRPAGAREHGLIGAGRSVAVLRVRDG
ncbi:hypothetical protein [Nonomuraea deserti]|nr:hypothetical protein [Nonomuraea deserti]